MSHRPPRRHQARQAPCGPEPQAAARRTHSRIRSRSRALCDATGEAGGAGSAVRRSSPTRPSGVNRSSNSASVISSTVGVYRLGTDEVGTGTAGALNAGVSSGTSRHGRGSAATPGEARSVTAPEDAPGSGRLRPVTRSLPTARHGAGDPSSGRPVCRLGDRRYAWGGRDPRLVTSAGIRDTGVSPRRPAAAGTRHQRAVGTSALPLAPPAGCDRSPTARDAAEPPGCSAPGRRAARGQSGGPRGAHVTASW